MITHCILLIPAMPYDLGQSSQPCKVRLIVAKSTLPINRPKSRSTESLDGLKPQQLSEAKRASSSKDIHRECNNGHQQSELKVQLQDFSERSKKNIETFLPLPVKCIVIPSEVPKKQTMNSTTPTTPQSPKFFTGTIEANSLDQALHNIRMNLVSPS